MGLTDDYKEEARKRKATRTRRLLIAAIIVLLILAGAGIGFGVYYLRGQQTPPVVVDKETPATTDDATVKSKVVSTVPPLASFFGMTTDQVVAAIGPQAALGSVTAANDTAVASVTQMAEISIAASDASASSGTAATGSNVASVSKPAKLYLSLDEAGTVVKVNYSVPLGNLGNTDMLFADLLADDSFLLDVLGDAGTGLTTFDQPVPDPSAYQTKTTASDGTQTVAKETWTFGGNTALPSAPTVWSLTCSYDRGASAQNSAQTVSTGDTSRMLYLTLY